MQGLIQSFLPGRVRLRSPLICKLESRQIILDAFKDLPGLKNITANEHTGSLLLQYDPAVLPTDSLMTLLPMFQKLQQLERQPFSSKTCDALKALLGDALALLRKGN